MVAHAERDYPYEACGVVTGGRYVPLANMADDPEISFRLPDTAFADYDVQAVFHSHPNGPRGASEADMKAAQRACVPFGGYSLPDANGSYWYGYGVPRPGLIGREFCYGVADCWSIIMDVYAMAGIAIPDYPRGDRFWIGKPSYYPDRLREAGFQPVVGQDPRPLDVALFHVKQHGTWTHGAVYIGNSQAIHHLQDEISRRSPMGALMRLFGQPRWYRYAGH